MNIKNANWIDGKLDLPSLSKDVLWYIKIKQDITSYGMTSHRLFPFWVENVYTFISSIKSNSNGNYLPVIQPDGSETKIYIDEDSSSLLDFYWIELP